MNITLISPTPMDICSFGVRSLSAYLKYKGHSVINIFLPVYLKGQRKKQEYRFSYGYQILNDITDISRESDLIGVSLMTNYFHAAVQLTHEIRKKLDVPIIWGGAHPTVRPEECLQFADMVCIGEGEFALSELMKKMSEDRPYQDCENFWFRENGNIIRNPVRPLIRDIDDLPFFDFELEGQFVIDIHLNRLVEMDLKIYETILPREPNLEKKSSIAFKTYTSRGCPHVCSYCINDFLRRLNRGENYLRMKRVDRVVEELRLLREKFPFIETFVFFDDTFIARSEREIEEFSRLYREKIGLPFHIQVSPTTVSKRKLDYLVKSGLVFVEMGIQSGNEKIKRLYQRKTSNEEVLKAANIIHRFKNNILPPCYHVILDNPWETTEDTMDTLDLIMKLPKPFWLKRASLVLFPGTKLYAIAKNENLIEDELREIYMKNLIVPKTTYCNFLIYLSGQNHFLRAILRLMAKKHVVLLLDRPFFVKFVGALQKIYEAGVLFSKGVRALFFGDFIKIKEYIKKRCQPLRYT